MYFCLFAAASLAAVLGYLAFRGSGGEEPQGTPAWRPNAAGVDADDLLRREPYMGVSCGVANTWACDRIGLAVYLREPARRVEAQIGGRDFDLSRSDYGTGRDFTGFLQPAGLRDGPLEITSDASGGRWIGGEPVSAPVKLWVRSADGGETTTSLEVRLMAGWG